jgi:hypothetical protein
MAASRTMKAGEVRRAKVILRLAAGQSYHTIMKQEGCGQDFVARWEERFLCPAPWQNFFGEHHGPRIGLQMMLVISLITFTGACVASMVVSFPL